jgi:S1-C subfamily serine protease
LVDYLIAADAPAAIAGMNSGDRIRSVNGEMIENMAHLMRVIGSTLVGSTVKVEVDRMGEPIELSVVLGARPNQINQQ